MPFYHGNWQGVSSFCPQSRRLAGSRVGYQCIEMKSRSRCCGYLKKGIFQIFVDAEEERVVQLAGCALAAPHVMAIQFLSGILNGQHTTTLNMYLVSSIQ